MATETSLSLESHQTPVISRTAGEEMHALRVLIPLPTVNSCLLTQIANQPIPRLQLSAFRHVDVVRATC